MALFKKTKKEETTCCCGSTKKLQKQENGEQSCCSGNCDCKKTDPEKGNGDGLIIKILGSGCKNCITLTENVKKALNEMQLEAEVIKVTDFAEITGYGVMSTPALVVNEKVVSYGKVLKSGEIIRILEK